MKRLVLLLWLFFSLPAQACLWRTETDLDGEGVTLNEESPEAWIEMLQQSGRWGRDASELAAKLQAEPGNRKYRNDYGVALAQTGQIPEALQIFRELESEVPGEYRTAANLGTVLELSGKNEEALEWIQEAIRRNPESHRGTEWVHVKILEAKLACAEDPKWLESHTILGTDFGRSGRPRATGKLVDQEERESVTQAIKYQLRERMSLVAPPDVYVGDLLFDLANLIALTKTVERGLAVLELSEKYGTSRPEMLQVRKTYFRSLLSDRPNSESDRSAFTKAVLSIVAATLTLVLLLLVWQRRRRSR